MGRAAVLPFEFIVAQLSLDSTALLRALEAAEARLAQHMDEVNQLNVYPVPDGDTGTNMLHTMRSAVASARRADLGVAEVMAAAAHGALMGARGNSGVILSQIFAGAKLAFAGREVVSGAEIAAALAKGRELAYQAVVQPVEGTILTAISAMAETVRGKENEDVGSLLDRAVAAGKDAVRRTPDLLPVLKQAGVVDAGALGLVYVIEGIADLVAGRPVELDRSALISAEAHAARPLAPTGAGPSWGYDVQFLVPEPSRSPAALREEMLAYGLEDETLGCVLVVGDESVIKVHVHTQQPHEILRVGLSAGRLRDVVVEDLDAMAAERERATGVTISQEDVALRPLAVVAVVSGDGFAAVCRSLGAMPLRGGPTQQPSVEELLRAIERAPGRSVILLPNDKDVLPAALRAAEAATKTVRVVPTRTMAQGMSALVAFDAQGELARVAPAMEDCANAARTLEVTRAVRAATIDGVKVRAGDHMALVDGKLVGTGRTAEEALVVAASRVERCELCTIYVGADVDEERTRDASEVLRDSLGCEVEVVQGGQPHYPYIVSTE